MNRVIVVDERWPVPARKLLNLVQQMLKVSRPQSEQLIHAGRVRVNGRVANRPQSILELGDRVEAEYEAEAFRKPPRDHTRVRYQPLRIVYEDRYLVVVDKPPALLTVPTPFRERNTLISLLEKRLQREGTGDRAYCVHRLDRGVSGLLVFGKQLAIAERMRDQFEARKPQRRYVAIVSGVLSQLEGTFQSYLATDEHLNRFSTANAEEGQLAITHYRTLSSLADLTIVEVRLETGRRNQIRVHFAEAGHPVLGDERYGGRSPSLRRLWPHRRLALHAATLGFTHPIDGEQLEFHSPLPSEMAALDRPSTTTSGENHSPQGNRRRRHR